MKKVTPEIFRAMQPALQKHIDGMPSSYPLDYQRIDHKTIPVLNVLNHFSGCRVIDIGSNFGMFSILASNYADSVVGIERGHDIHAVSVASKNFFSENGFDLSNLELLNSTVSHIKSMEYDALLMTLVLYHLNDQEIDLLVKDASEKCKKAIIQCRPGRGIEFHKGKLTDHVSRNDRFDGLYDIAGNIRFLQEIGMTKISVSVNEKLFGTEVFPVIVAER